MRSQLFENADTGTSEPRNNSAFSLIDVIGARSRPDLSPKKGSHHDVTEARKIEAYQGDYSQTRGAKNPPISSKLRENRSIPNTIQAGLEDSLDKFQKERLRDSHSPSHNDERFSPTRRNSPNKLGSYGEIPSPSKRDPNSGQGFFNNSPTRLELNSSKASISSITKLHSPKNSYVENEIIAQQKPLEKRFDPSTRIREYNIVTGEKASPNTSILSGLPFGYVARSLERGLEDVHMKPVLQYKKIDESAAHSPLQRQKSYFTEKEIQTYDKKLDDIGFVAGKNNFYGETEFRYANKLQAQEPLSPNQFYSAKALKNMSGFKLY